MSGNTSAMAFLSPSDISRLPYRGKGERNFRTRVFIDGCTRDCIMDTPVNFSKAAGKA